MQNNILIATKNKSKFELITNFFQFCNIFSNYNFMSLNDISNLNIIDLNEQGNLLERAKQKVLNIINNNSYRNINKYKYIIGIDDGIEIDNKIIEDVKKIIPSIINNNLLKENEVVFICRAFSIYNTYNKDYNNIITKIPFKYKKFIGDVNELKNTFYPLSYVLCTLNSNKPVIKMNKEEENNYYKMYSKELLIINN